MKRPHQITGAVLILFAAVIARQALRLEFFTKLGPGPGFFPFWLCVLLALLSAIMVYQATFRPTDPMPKDFFPSRHGSLRIAAIALAVAGMVVLLKPLGLRLTALLFLVFLLFVLGRVRPIVTVLVALAGSFGVFYVFDSLLKVPLPVGVFGV